MFLKFFEIGTVGTTETGLVSDKTYACWRLCKTRALYETPPLELSCIGNGR